MNALDAIVIVWLTILSFGQAGVLIYVSSARKELRQRASDLSEIGRRLDIAAGLQQVQDLIRTRNIHADRELRSAIEILIASLEADPLAKDKHWTAIQALRQRLTP